MRKIFKFLVSKKKFFLQKKSKILVIDSIFFNELSRLFSSKLHKYGRYSIKRNKLIRDLFHFI